ncbi:MAG TPA: SulP family inorganic anion transporter, partial [Thermomicrobiales bacterium]|nr:SulP family inorganic anion transporter [Thermomicrobiales bacterium]
GSVPSGLPSVGIPDVGWDELTTIIPVAGAIFIVILAQSAATSRSYAARYNERFDENVDLVGLSGANIAAGLTGTFVVNGSPTKTQIVDSAGGRSQVASISASVVVLIVLLFLTRPLAYLPNAVLATIVFIIGVELVDVAGMRKIFNRRSDEFIIAAITAAVVVILGVEQGIILAMVLSIIDHLRLSYHPHDTYLTTNPAGHWGSTRVSVTDPPVAAIPGLVIYRFGASLYYANANLFQEEMRHIITSDPPPTWLCLDAAEIGDIDFSGGEVLAGLLAEMEEHGVRLVFADLPDAVRSELIKDGTSPHIGDDAFFGSTQEVVEAFQQRESIGTRPV